MGQREGRAGQFIARIVEAPKYGCQGKQRISLTGLPACSSHLDASSLVEGAD